MRTRDPDAKRRQLLEAALAEFAEHGLGGARVDRLARRASVSAGLVYSFFDGKEGLYDAVYHEIVEQAVTGIPIDADDLGEYAGRLHDAGLLYPDVGRFIARYTLDRAGVGVRPVVAKSMAEKAAAIEDAQRRGVVTGRQPAAELLALVLTLANMWHSHGEDIRALAPEDRHRGVVVDAVRRLVAP